MRQPRHGAVMEPNIEPNINNALLSIADKALCVFIVIIGDFWVYRNGLP